MQVTQHHSCRVSPFGHPRIHARLAAPRGISQPPTSFIGSRCQGIHHAPLNTYKTQKPETKIAKQTKPKILLVRCSQPLSTNQTPHPTTKAERQHTTPHQPGCTHHPRFPRKDEEVTGLLSQSPIVCPAVQKSLLLHRAGAHYRYRPLISLPH